MVKVAAVAIFWDGGRNGGGEERWEHERGRRERGGEEGRGHGRGGKTSPDR